MSGMRNWKHGPPSRRFRMTEDLPAPGGAAEVSTGEAPETPEAPQGTGAKRSRWPKWFPRPVRRVTKVLIFAFVVQFLVLPQIQGTRKALRELGHVHVTYLIAGVAFETAAIVSYAFLTRSVLPREQPCSVLTLLRVQLSTLGFSHVAPGGTAAGSPLGYRLLTHAGIDGADAGFAIATQGAGSAVVLNVILWLALVVSIPFNGFNPLYLSAALVGVLAIGAFAGLVVSLTTGEERSAKVFTALATRVPFVSPVRVNDLVHKVAERLRQLGSDRELLVRAASWAAANWLLDAASLWVFVAAFGYRVSVVSLLVAFGVANVLAAIPITPGGLGVVEAVLTALLVGFGAPTGVAVLGVASYRLLNFWLPIPLGGLSYLSLQVDPGDPEGKVLEQRKQRLRRWFQRVTRSLVGSRPHSSVDHRSQDG